MARRATTGPPSGKAYPSDSRSNDLWFQHFAVVVADMDAAYARLKRFDAVPITDGGPQTLPAQNGGVRAYKFRDPDGHPLELLYFPPGIGRALWRTGVCGPIYCGIDHSALAVANPVASTAFYRELLGFELVGHVVNRGPTQEALDGTFNAVVDITALRPLSDRGPGIELLGYRTPPDGRASTKPFSANDLVRTQLQFTVTELDAIADTLRAAGVRFVSPDVVALDARRFGYSKALMTLDPDDHMLLLIDGEGKRCDANLRQQQKARQ